MRLRNETAETQRSGTATRQRPQVHRRGANDAEPEANETERIATAKYLESCILRLHCEGRGGHSHSPQPLPKKRVNLTDPAVPRCSGGNPQPFPRIVEAVSRRKLSFGTLYNPEAIDRHRRCPTPAFSFSVFIVFGGCASSLSL